MSETTQSLIDQAKPWVEAEIRRVGHGNVPCDSPYDLAAVHLLCREAGVPVGDAAGRSPDDEPVPGSGSEYQIARIASGSCKPQAHLIEVVQCGIKQPPRPACEVRR